MPALFAINPTTGEVLSNFVRTPDIDTDGNFNGAFLSSTGDKVHCAIEDLETNTCLSVDAEVVDASEYVRHGSSGGYEGLAMMADGSVTAFIERNAGGTLDERGEPGIRVFKVNAEPLEFDSFLGFYEFEPGACCIADASPLPGSATKIAVAERARLQSRDRSCLSQATAGRMARSFPRKDSRTTASVSLSLVLYADAPTRRHHRH